MPLAGTDRIVMLTCRNLILFMYEGLGALNKAEWVNKGGADILKHYQPHTTRRVLIDEFVNT